MWSLGLGGLILIGGLFVAGEGQALALGTNLFTESFENSTATAALTLPPSSTGDPNVACLTAGTSTTQTPIPGCDLTTPDATGSGALRLTGATVGKVGGVFSDLSLPSGSGIDDTFTSYQYGGTLAHPADGIAFIINAEDPANPAPPAVMGRTGGSLGYSASYPTSPTPTDGLADGYLGIGFDTYGNFSGQGYEGRGCTVPSWLMGQPDQVVVRGPGTGLVGYCALEGSQHAYGGSQAIGGSTGTTRAASAVPVEVVLNTTGSSYSMTGSGFTGVSVPAGDYGVAWTPISGSAKDMVGPLPSTKNTEIPANLYPTSWINPTTGIPYQLGFGWVASTGSFTNIHEVTNLVANTINPVPVLTAAIIDSESHAFTQGGTAKFTLTAGVSASGANETQTVTMKTTLPTGLTPGAASGTGWICHTVGQAVTCSYAPTGSIIAGTTLPPVSLDAAVASNASTATGAMSTTVTVTSTDGNPAQATDMATASPPPVYPPPTVTSVTPSTGTTAGGTPVTITGTEFSADSLPTTFSFGPADATDVTCSSTTTCTAVTPSGSAGPVTVVATADGGQMSSGGPTYTYVTPTPTTTTTTTTTTTVPTPTPTPPPTPTFGFRDVAADGGVFAFGSDGFYGSVPQTPVAANVRNIVGIAPTASNHGYWLVGNDGGVFAFGDAGFLGSLPALKISVTNVSGVAGDPLAAGYWLVSSDGAVYAFGQAPFYGSLIGSGHVVKDIVGIAPTPDAHGYWLVGAGGTVYPFGDAQAFPSVVGHLNGPIVAIAAAPGLAQGYWLAGADGGVFAFGSAAFFGSSGSTPSTVPVVGIAPAAGGGYWLAKNDGSAFNFGDAPNLGTAGAHLNAPMVSQSR